MARRVLLVDDEPKVLESLSEALAAEGLEVLTAESAEQALGLVASRKPEVILSDVRMPGVSGLELLRLVKDRAPSVDVIVMTAYDDMPTVVEAMREGASDFLTKPVDLQGLRSVMDRMFRDRRARREAAEGEREAGAASPEPGLGPLVGRDPKMIEVYKKVGQLAGTRVTVLITGETGTGKELVARAIHDSSPWAEEPFVPLNCTAIPEGLLESELFGHVRGAFTGAVNDRRGRFAMAGRGTLFLDEIGDTPLGFQAKLLRVLEERSFVPVGAESAEKSEARVIAATHHPLEERIETGEFRKDLYYRLRVVKIHLPPLRERRGDIPQLARHLIRRATRELERPAPTLTKATEDLLVEHEWPGNVRELENCLTRAIALATGHVIRPADLAFVGKDEVEAADYRSLEQWEREHVQRILRVTGGNKTRAAEILGVSRPRLYRLIEKHGLTADPDTGRAD